MTSGEALEAVIMARLRELLRDRQWYRANMWAEWTDLRKESEIELRALVKLARMARKLASEAPDPMAAWRRGDDDRSGAGYADFLGHTDPHRRELGSSAWSQLMILWTRLLGLTTETAAWSLLSGAEAALSLLGMATAGWTPLPTPNDGRPG